MSASGDHHFMSEALRLARGGLYSARPNPRVGCVLVSDGAVVGRGFHHHAGGPHAEVVALTDAAARAAGATAYVTLEPCCHQGRTPPCCDALIAAGVSRVVFATADPNPLVDGGGARKLAAAGVALTAGMLEGEARELNRGFFLRLERGRPHVCVKTAMSLDGRTALASGESQWITGSAARADVQRLRARSCAVVTGIGTLLADDPLLNVRDERFDIAERQPCRVVLDSGLRTPPAAALLQTPGEVCIFTGSQDERKTAVLRDAGARVERLPLSHGRVDLAALLERLAEMEVNEVLVEAGATLTGAFVDAGLVDELIVYLAPRLLGADARGAFDLAGVATLGQAPRLLLREVRAVGQDWRITAVPA